jgi:hypothetical protein
MPRAGMCVTAEEDLGTEGLPVDDRNAHLTRSVSPQDMLELGEPTC